MSVIEMNQVVTEEVVVDKEMRTLPGKYSKFAGFAYWLLAQMADQQLLSGDAYDATCKMMNLLSGDIAAQIAFYERYFAEASVSAKIMKDDIKKAVKAKKEPKVNKEPKAKKEKKEKKEQVEITNNDIIAKLVECANSVMVGQIEVPLIEPIETSLMEEKNRGKKAANPVEEVPQGEKKKRGRKAVNPVMDPVMEPVMDPVMEPVVVPVMEPVVDTEVVEKKKRGKKAMNPVVAEGSVTESVEKKKRGRKAATPELVKEEVQKEEVQDEDEEEDLILHSVSVDGVEYFYDEDNRLYNADHSIIGTFDPVSLSISIL